MLTTLLQETSIVSLLLAATPYISSLLIIVFILFGIILNYHWQQYAVHFIPVQLARVLYLVIGGIIILTMLSAQALI